MPREGNPYRIPLALSKEMKLGLTRLAAQLETAEDFATALRVFRAGLIVYGVLGEEELQAMYVRGLVKDDEAQFLAEAKLCGDFRPVKVEALHQAEDLLNLNTFFGKVAEQWGGLRESSRMGHLERARKYLTLPNARKIVELARAEERRLEVSK